MSSDGHYGLMVMPRRALVLLPGDFPEDPGAYEAACRTLGLAPDAHGYVIYRGQSAAGSRALACAALGEPRVVQDADRDGAGLPGSQKTGQQAGQAPTPAEVTLRDSCQSAEAADQRGIDLTGHLSARVVVNASSGKLEGVGVLNASTGTYEVVKPEGVAKPEGKVETAVHEAVTQALAEALVGAIWPVPLPVTGSLKAYDALCQAAEFLLEPKEFLLKMINAVARAAAVHAGFGPLAPLIAQIAEDLCAEFIHPSPADQAAGDVVKIIDIDLYAKDGKLADCPTLRELSIEATAAEIGKLLGSRPGTPIAKHVHCAFPASSSPPATRASRRGGKVAASEGSGNTGVVKLGTSATAAQEDPLVVRAVVRMGGHVTARKGESPSTSAG